MEAHEGTPANDEELKEQFEEGIETPKGLNEDKEYNIQSLSSRMQNEADAMLGYIKMHESSNDLSSLLNDTKMIETKLLNYLENEDEDIKKKQAYMIFNNSNALIDAAQDKKEGKRN